MGSVLYSLIQQQIAEKHMILALIVGLAVIMIVGFGPTKSFEFRACCFSVEECLRPLVSDLLSSFCISESRCIASRLLSLPLTGSLGESTSDSDPCCDSEY